MRKTFFEKFDIFNKNSTEKNICNCIKSGVIIGQNSIVRNYCELDTEVGFLIDDKFNYIWLDTDNITAQLAISEKLFSEKAPSLFCNECLKHSCHEENNSTAPIKHLHLSHWKCCLLDCKYCKREKTDDISTVKHFDIMPVIEQLLDKKLIDKKTEIVFDCGDAALHPEFDKLIYFFINYEMENIIINTTASRYCHSISDAIGKNIAKIIVPIDSGCSYVYQNVKGVNKYDIAIANVKRYQEFEDKKQKRIIFKYTLVHGINDNDKEFLDFYIHAKNLGIKKLYLDIDKDWFMELVNTPQGYLNDIILFAENISKINDFEIEFSPKIKFLHSRIK